MLRNPILPRIIIVFPIIIMIVMPMAMNMEIKDVNVAIVDADHSDYSRKLVDKIGASNYFNLKNIFSSYAEALDKIERGEVDVIVEIPNDFSKNIISAKNSSVQISANAVNGVKGGLASNYMSSLVTDFGKDIKQEVGASVSPNIDINIIPKYRFNIFQYYELYMVPALMVMILTMICGFLPALNIVTEKEMGTIEQINVSPVSRFMFVFSKMLPYWIVGLLVFTLSFGVAYLIYGICPAGSMLEVYLIAVIYVITISGFGLIVSNNSDTVQQAMFLMFFFVILFILMSGLFTPINSMPDWAKAITFINPLRYFIDLIRGIVIRGASICDMSGTFIALCIYAIVSSSVAINSYRKRN